MTDAVPIEALADHVGDVVQLSGWLYNKRSSKKLHFLELRDGTGIVQCVVFKGDVSPELFELAGHIPQETSLSLVGDVREHPKHKGVFEIGVKELSVIAEAAEYPITPKEHGTDFLMDHRHLWLRSKRQHAIIRVRHAIVQAIRNFFDERDFTLVDAPIFTPNACEGTSTLFETDYHGQPAYLTQSGQLYMEAASAAFGKVYCFGPTFRAEKSKTRRHLAEFWMVEPEVAFMDLAGRHAARRGVPVLPSCSTCCRHDAPELEVLERDISKLENVKPPFPRITYHEAIEILREAGHDAKPGDDFGGDEETVISARFDRPVIVHRYPTELKAFYMKQDPENPGLALCMDVLAPRATARSSAAASARTTSPTLEAKVERAPAAARSVRVVLRRAALRQLPPRGVRPGIERSVAWMCGLPHVRETIPFPRMLNRLSP